MARNDEEALYDESDEDDIDLRGGTDIPNNHDLLSSSSSETTRTAHAAVALFASSTSVGFAWFHPSRHVVECGEVLTKMSLLAESAISSTTSAIDSGHHPADPSCNAPPAAIVDSNLPRDLPAQLRWLHLTLAALQPRVVIIPSKGCSTLSTLLAQSSLAIAPTLQPPGEFSVGKCRDQMKFLWPDASALSWASRLNLSNESMLMALSALLSHVIRAGLPVADLAEVAPISVMHVDRNALRALHVFREERHPAAAHGLGVAKESLSLFSILNRVQSAAGRLTLRQWCSVPVCDPMVTMERHDAVDFFSKNADMARQVLLCLRQCRHPGKLIRKIQTMKHATREYQLLEHTCCTFLELAELIQTSPVRLEALRLPCILRLVEKIRPEPLQRMIQAIRRTIDFSGARRTAAVAGGGINNSTRPAASRGCQVNILSGVDAQLDELRLYLSNMATFLTATAQRVVNALPPFYQSIPMGVAFFPSLGYLVTIDSKSSGVAFSLRSGDGLPTGWEIAFATEDGLYCKNDAMRELDEGVGDIHASISERMASVQQALDVQLLALAPDLLPLQDCGEVECLASFAVLALEERWVRPTMIKDPIVDLTNAFHPLLSRTSSNVVPFSFRVGHEKRVCVVTGANGSGKSVLVHTVPLIVFMAHIGCFVPCSSATIGIFEQLLLDTCGWGSAGSSNAGGGQQIRNAPELSSSFGAELCLVSRIVEQANNRGMITLDEFGKGTLANDGIALLASIIDYFLSLGPQGPVVLITTHYTEVFAKRLVDVARVHRLHMKVVARLPDSRLLPAIPSSSSSSTLTQPESTELCYLYQPEPCSTLHVASSQAFHCAIAASVPPAVAKRALLISRRLTLGIPVQSTDASAASTMLSSRQQQYSPSAADQLVATFLQIPLSLGPTSETLNSIGELARAVLAPPSAGHSMDAGGLG